MRAMGIETVSRINDKHNPLLSMLCSLFKVNWCFSSQCTLALLIFKYKLLCLMSITEILTGFSWITLIPPLGGEILINGDQVVF